MQVTILEAARILRVSEHTVRRRLRSGELEGVQVAGPGGFSWVVTLPEGVQGDGPDTGELAAMKTLVDHLERQLDAQQSQLEVKDKQIQELHVLLQQAQASLPAPRNNRPWWRRWWGN
jgi:excisionase family DNA binding protein